MYIQEETSAGVERWCISLFYPVTAMAVVRPSIVSVPPFHLPLKSVAQAKPCNVGVYAVGKEMMGFKHARGGGDDRQEKEANALPVLVCRRIFLCL